MIKVHVSVTFPADLSFRSSRNDRGLLASGPALLQLKVEARRLLRSQGFAESEIPEPLRERPLPADYDMLVDAREASRYGARALNVHNEVGFGRKEATLTQAILYTLAPPDTVIVAPDSLWASPFWAGQLAGAALRGCHVYVVAPSLDNAPAAGASILERMRREPLPGTESAVYYLTVGSKNQDPRSTFLDGETSFAVAGPWSLVAYSDFLLLMSATTWVENEAGGTVDSGRPVAYRAHPSR